VVATAVAKIDPEFPSMPSTATGYNEGSLATTGRETFQALVMQALQLRRIYREVFILCDIKSYTVAETAAILGISEDSVTRRLRRARSQMRDGQQQGV
jgi:DNA-directed RNA polymerase specialized sigma24 family protein